MKRITEFSLENGGTALVEIDETVQMGSAQAGRDLVRKASLTLEQAMEKVAPAAQVVLAKIRGIARESSPDEISIEFGIKVKGDLGAVLAAVGAEANYKVTLKWSGA